MFICLSQSLSLSVFWNSEVACSMASYRENLSVLAIVVSYV